MLKYHTALIYPCMPGGLFVAKGKPHISLIVSEEINQQEITVDKSGAFIVYIPMINRNIIKKIIAKINHISIDSIKLIAH